MYSFTAENNTSKEFQHYTTASIIPATTSIASTTATSSTSNTSIYTEGIYAANSHRHEPLYPFNDMLYSLDNPHQNNHYSNYNQQHYNTNNFDNQQQYDSSSQQHYDNHYDLQQQNHFSQQQYNLPQTQQHFDLQQQQQQQQPNQWSYPQYFYNNHPHHSSPQSHIHDNNPSTTLYTVSQNSSSQSLTSQTNSANPTTTPKTTQQRPRITTSIWDDEGTICYQVDVRGICVARRQDNDMINGTKLLNVTGMSRGKRDGILKNERGRVVVKVGAMHLKGVWVPFARAKTLAIQYNILDQLHPLFVDEPAYYFYQQQNYLTNTSNNPIYLQQQQQSEMLYQQLPHVPSVPSMIPYYNQQETNTTLSPHSSSITVMSSPSTNLPPPF